MADKKLNLDPEFSADVKKNVDDLAASLQKVVQDIEKSNDATNMWFDATKSVAQAESNIEKAKNKIIGITDLQNKLAEEGSKITNKDLVSSRQRLADLRRMFIMSRTENIANEVALKDQTNSKADLSRIQKEINRSTENELLLKRDITKESILIYNLEKKRDIVYNAKNQLLPVELSIAQELLENEKARLAQAKLLAGINQHLIDPLLKDTTELGKLQKAAIGIMMGGWGSLLALWDAALDRYIELEKAAGEFRKTTGLIIPISKDLSQSARLINVQYTRFGITLEKAYESATALYDAFQTTSLVSEELMRRTAIMAANVGLAVKDVADFESHFSELAKSSGTTSENIESSLVALSTMGKVAPRQVMNDIATASEHMYEFMAKAPLQMMRAAVEARRMGTTIKSIADSARGMLNYQESMTSELEASALLNQNISFQLSRQLSWEGKIVEAREEALRQISMAGDFTKLTVYQQEALAKAAGLTVEEIIKQKNQQKALNALRAAGDPSAKAFDEMSKKMRANNKDSEQAILERGKATIKEQLMQSKIEQLSNAIKSIWTSISDILWPIADAILPSIIVVVQDFAKGLAWCAQWATKLSGIIHNWFWDFDELDAKWSTIGKHAVGWVTALGVAAGAAWLWFSKIKNIVSGIGGGGKGGLISRIFGGGLDKIKGGISGLSSGIGNFMKSVGTGVKSFFKGIADIIGYFGAKEVILGAATMVILAGSLWIVSKALQNFMGLDWKAFAMAAASMGLLLGVGAIIIIFSAAITTALPAIIPAMLVLGGLSVILIGLGFAATLFGKAATLMADALPKMVDPLVALGMAGSSLFVAAGGIAAIGYALAAFGVGGGIGAIIGKLTGGNGLIDQIVSLGSIAPQLNMTAVALEKIASALIKIQSIGKIENLDELTAAAVRVNNVASTSSTTANNGGNSIDSTAIVDAIDNLCTELKSGKVAVYLDKIKVSRALA
jgi:hypothetical protein